MSLERIERLWATRIAEMAKVALAVLLAGLVVWLWGYREATNVAAQSGTVVWSDPIQLSDPKVDAWAPTIAVDRAGNVHVMWSQTMTENPPPGAGDTLFYTRWDGKEWSPRIDVLVSPGGAAAEFPTLAITPDGTLHAVWGTGGMDSQLMYANAPACCADVPQNWSPRMSLGMPINLTTALVADERGRLHAAFASLEMGNVVYRRSDDGGATWPVWIEIGSDLLVGDEFAGYPRLAVDGRGRVHAVWTVMPWPGRAVVYARSDDGGDTWSASQAIDRADREDYEANYGPFLIDIEAHGDDEIHLIWDGAPTVERNHVWSSDGGNSWSQFNMLFPEVSGVGRSGWNDMVVDSGGTSHAVSLSADGPPLHATWDGKWWSVSNQISTVGPTTRGTELLALALSQGNMLHAFWVRFVADETQTVWYSHAQTSTPAIGIQPLPTFAPASVTTSAVEDPSVTGSVVPTMHVQHSSEDIPSTRFDAKTSLDSLEVLLIGVIPTALIIGIVFVVNIRRARQ